MAGAAAGLGSPVAMQLPLTRVLQASGTQKETNCRCNNLVAAASASRCPPAESLLRCRDGLDLGQAWRSKTGRQPSVRRMVTAMAHSEDRFEQDIAGHSGPYRSLPQLCVALERSYFEVCVRNLGRPTGRALYDFVAATVEAWMAGYGRSKLALELRYGPESVHGIGLNTAGFRLTSSEERYRSLWLDAIYATLHMMRLPGPLSSASSQPVTNEPWLISTVYRVLEGHRTGEELSLVRFDRALATAGASGGTATELNVIAPQWVPISQLILLTLKVINEVRESRPSN